MSNANRDTQPIPTSAVTVVTTPERLQRWRERAAEIGVNVEAWLELVADNAIAALVTR